MQQPALGTPRPPDEPHCAGAKGTVGGASLPVGKPLPPPPALQQGLGPIHSVRERGLWMGRAGPGLWEVGLWALGPSGSIGSAWLPLRRLSRARGELRKPRFGGSLALPP